MLNRFKGGKVNSDFGRKVITLLTGTSISVLIPIMISPILTRIYTPNDMGVLAIFASAIAIIGSIVNGRYEFAILLPKKNTDAINLLSLGFVINLIISMSLLLILGLWGKEILIYFQIENLIKWMFLLPLATFFTGLMNLLYVYNNRIEEYKDIAQSVVYRSISLSTLQLLFGILIIGPFGLIIGETFSKLFANIKLFKNLLKTKRLVKLISFVRMKNMAIKYINFPKFDVLATLFNVSSFHLIAIFFNIFFSNSIAGYFYLTQKVLGAPITIIASAISDVFKQNISHKVNNREKILPIYMETLKKLFLIAILPSLILLLFVDDLFILFFGEDWGNSGFYAQIMVPMLFFRFLSNPLSFMFYIGEKQKTNLLLQMLLIIGIVFSFVFFKTDLAVVFSLSSVFSLFYLLQLYFSSRIAKFINLKQ